MQINLHLKKSLHKKMLVQLTGKYSVQRCQKKNKQQF